MNIINLKEYFKTSNTIKNYKELCAILKIKVLAGNAKKAQLKELERYFKYHKEGNKFIIDEIYPEILPKIENRGGHNKTEYIASIEKLILDLLLQSGNIVSLGFGRVFLSKNQLLKEFEMINDNYVYCKKRIPKLSKFMNIDLETVKEWYDINDNMLERNLIQALNNLENQSLILWSREITIAEAIPQAEVLKDGTEIIKRKYIDEYGDEQINYKYYANDEIILHYREGTDKEKTFILDTEKEIEIELGCKNKQQVIQLGLWEYFKNKVDDIVLKELNIAFYYKSYKILFNEKHIALAIEDIYKSFELSKKDRIHEKSILNIGVMNRTIDNASKRHERAIEEKSKIIGNIKDDNKNERIKRRSDDNYISDNVELGNSLIIKNAIDIKEQVKRTKINIDTFEIDNL